MESGIAARAPEGEVAGVNPGSLREGGPAPGPPPPLSPPPPATHSSAHKESEADPLASFARVLSSSSCLRTFNVSSGDKLRTGLALCLTIVLES